MAQFLDLPIEIRNMIYRNVARRARVRFAYMTVFPLSTCGALLVCCKQINAEFFPAFLELARIDFSRKIHRKTGVVQLPGIQSAAIQHVSLGLNVFASDGGMILLKNMSNLKSFTYKAVGYYNIPGSVLKHVEACHNKDDTVPDDPSDECCDICSEKCAVDHLKDQVNKYPDILLGNCTAADDENGCNGDPQCCAGNPIRKVIGVWEYTGKPFKLIAQVYIEDLEFALDDDWIGFFDLGSKEMVICSGEDHDDIKTRFLVDLHGY
ncbi:uncharacterized protein AB675_6455 [Cyphellophora attinorum]|uniref:Uncharacterized protein n=1 Tax=Cyphellophora attinorum TaxID=1664694 RepID=A0A0N1P2K0_9EURO|nr:uncharacterized protein AB675_6455 [Phialophora attinorum]KPI43983.1 hypothetical protein AB675_6455 [Phialophora attinorum]